MEHLVLNMKPCLRSIIDRFALTGFVCAVLVWIVGCARFAQHPDPLAGWHVSLDEEPDKVIMEDSHKYLTSLSPGEMAHARLSQYFKDGTGQHALEIIIGVNGTNWRHVLFYDRDDKRIKTVKYVTGHSRS